MNRTHTVNTPSLLYVSLTGDDTNSGTIDSPLKTIGAAQKRARVLLEEPGHGPVTVVVRKGVYYLREPLIFSSADSGTREGPMTYCAFDGEEVVLSGAVRVQSTWKRGQNGVWQCPVDRTLAEKSFTQLFVNGRREIRARTPKYDPRFPFRDPNRPELQGYSRVGDGDGSLLENKPEGASMGFFYDPNTFVPNSSWDSPTDAVVHAFPRHNYGNLQWRLHSIDSVNKIIWVGHGGYQIKGAAPIKGRAQFFIENVREELSDQREWFFDTRESILYYKPSETVDVHSAVIEAPVLSSLIEFRGTPDRPVRHVTIHGLTLRHTASTFLEPYEILPSGDWAIHRGGAVFLEGAEDIAVELCDFDAVGGNGVFISNYNRRIHVRTNRFAEAGESAVCSVGSMHLTSGSVEIFPADISIENNLIHDCGAFGKQVAGVFVSFSRACVIAHNHIYNMPRAGICLNDCYMGGHVIEFNRIIDTVRETWDHGPINVWHRGYYWCHEQSHTKGFNGRHESGNVMSEVKFPIHIRNNFLKNHGSWGIDLDDGSSNIFVQKNICVGVAMKLREGSHRTVENNIFWWPANPPGAHVGYDNSHDIFRRNIVVTDPTAISPERDASFLTRTSSGDLYQFIWPPIDHPWIEMDYNLLHNKEVPFYVAATDRSNNLTKFDLQQWRDLGYDIHSVFADPRFVAPENEDFRLQPDSPAHSLGFEQIDTSGIGLLPDFPPVLRK